jgi:hypothetical protein
MNITELTEFDVHFKKDVSGWVATYASSQQTDEAAGYGGLIEEALHDLINEEAKDDYQKEVDSKRQQ